MLFTYCRENWPLILPCRSGESLTVAVTYATNLRKECTKWKKRRSNRRSWGKYGQRGEEQRAELKITRRRKPVCRRTNTVSGISQPGAWGSGMEPNDEGTRQTTCRWRNTNRNPIPTNFALEVEDTDNDLPSAFLQKLCVSGKESNWILNTFRLSLD